MVPPLRAPGLLVAMLLAACGGGGSGSHDASANDAAADASAGRDGGADRAGATGGNTGGAAGAGARGGAGGQAGSPATGGSGTGGVNTGGVSTGGAISTGGVNAGGTGIAGQGNGGNGTGGGIAGSTGGSAGASGGNANGGGGTAGGNGGFLATGGVPASGGAAGAGGGNGGSSAQGGQGGSTANGGVGGAGAGGNSGGAGGQAPGCAVVGDELRLTNSVGSSRSPRLALDGNHFVVTWADARNGTAAPFAAAVAISGTKLAPEAPVFSPVRPGVRPGISTDGARLLSVWEEITTGGTVNVLGLPLAHDLTPTVASPVNLATTSAGEARAQVVETAGHTFLGWMDATAPGLGADGGVSSPGVAWLARLGVGPSVDSSPAPVSLGHGGTVLFPYLAVAGPTLAVAYVEELANHSEVRLATFDADLHLQRDVLVRDDASAAATPSVAWDGTRWVVTWEDLRSGTEQMFVSFVAAAGTATTPFMLGPTDANWPRVASNGAGVSLFAYYAFPNHAQVTISAVGPSGAPLGGDVQISHTNNFARFPSVAYDPGSGDFGLVWEDNRNGGDYEIYYARIRCALPSP